jgi:uncharacterized protein (DUF2252 family)
MDVDERAARGRAERETVPRSSHAEFEPAADREDPVDILERQAATRIPELVPIRYGRMLESRFAFYRGGAAIMAADLAPLPRTSLQAQLCGDAHAANLGVFASPERRLVFDVNDFDETSPGPWEWDVKRLVASLAVVGRDNGFSAKERGTVVRETAASYRSAMRTFAGMGDLEVWYSRQEVDSLTTSLGPALNRQQRKRLDRGVAKARSRTSMTSYSKLTHEVDGEPRIVSDPPLIVPVDELEATAPEAQRERVARAFLRGYSESLSSDRRVLLGRYRLVDLARKVVGVGSVGLQTWIALLLGRDADDPLFLQLKEAQPSVLEPFVGASGYRNHGARVVAGQRLMQATSDIFLGWRRMPLEAGAPIDFYARQLKDWKGSVELEELQPEEMAAYGQTCGWALARGHARSGDRVAIAAYLGGGTPFDQAMVSFAEAYADQNERDYAALAEAARSGRVKAEAGV